jgi:anti-sigma-K factor RskA
LQDVTYEDIETSMLPEPIDLCTDFQPQLAAYALGEAEAGDELLTHLAACPTCQRDLHAYVQVAWMLPYDAPEVAPPPELRQRLLAAVEPAAHPPASKVSSESVMPPRQPRSPRWRLPSFQPAFAFAVVVAVALVGWNITLQNRLGILGTQMTASRESWQTMIELLNDPALRWYRVTGDQASGHFWAAPQDRVACLVVQGLPALAPDRVYQVWMNQGSRRMSGGLFEAHDGDAWILIHANEPMASYDSIGVTVEPRGGSAAPTGLLIMQGRLESAQPPTAADRRRLVQSMELTAQWDN